MKTTIEIQDEIFYQAKEIAVHRRTTFRAIVEEALILSLNAKKKKLSDDQSKPYRVDADGNPYIPCPPEMKGQSIAPLSSEPLSDEAFIAKLRAL